MNIAFLIMGLIVIYILTTIASNQVLICKNQVQQTKLLLEQFNKKIK